MLKKGIPAVQSRSCGKILIVNKLQPIGKGVKDKPGWTGSPASSTRWGARFSPILMKTGEFSVDEVESLNHVTGVDDHSTSECLACVSICPLP
jgi:hypothetical protein